jgi:hypothetical protein
MAAHSPGCSFPRPRGKHGAHEIVQDGQANSTRVLDRMNQSVVNRLQRWRWRKGGCARNLGTTTTWEELQARWGLYRLRAWVAWKRARV